MSEKKRNTPGFRTRVENDTLILCDTLMHGLKIGDQVHKEFEIRESTVDDLYLADELAHAQQVNKYDAAMLCQQLVRIGDFRGPFTLGMLGKLKLVDFEILRSAMLEVELLGKPAPPSDAN